MRNRIAHEYDGIDVAVIWEAAEDKLPPFLETVRAVLDLEENRPS